MEDESYKRDYVTVMGHQVSKWMILLTVFAIILFMVVVAKTYAATGVLNLWIETYNNTVFVRSGNWSVLRSCEGDSISGYNLSFDFEINRAYCVNEYGCLDSKSSCKRFFNLYENVSECISAFNLTNPFDLQVNCTTDLSPYNASILLMDRDEFAGYVRNQSTADYQSLKFWMLSVLAPTVAEYNNVTYQLSLARDERDTVKVSYGGCQASLNSTNVLLMDARSMNSQKDTLITVLMLVVVGIIIMQSGVGRQIIDRFR